MRFTSAALLCTLSGLAVESQANPLTMFGSGSRGASMGGAHTAAARDSSANFYNPALLSRLTDLEIDLSYRLAVPDLRLNDLSLDVDSARGTQISLGMPGQVGKLRVGAGVSVYLPDQQLMRLRSLSQEQPRFALYDNRAQRLFLAVNASVALGDKLSIGGGLGYLTATAGGVSLGGRVGFPDAGNSELLLEMDVDVTTLVYPSLGMAYQLRPWLRIGASYRGGRQPVTDLQVNIEGDIGAAEVDPIVEDAAVNLRSISLSHFQPSEFAVGVEARLGAHWLLAADLVMHRWSAFRNPAALLESQLELGQFNEFLQVPEAVVLAPANYHDILIPRGGIEWRALARESYQLDTRLGYSYEPSPAPEQIGITNFVDNDKHTGSLGLGLSIEGPGALTRPLSLDLGFSYTHLSQRDHRKLSPIDPVGDYRSTGGVWQLSTTSRFRF